MELEEAREQAQMHVRKILCLKPAIKASSTGGIYLAAVVVRFQIDFRPSFLSESRSPGSARAWAS
jgi:hypothetical protein